MVDRTCATLSVLFLDRMSAASPATCGEAIDVPSMKPCVSSGIDDQMFTPGADTEHFVPKLENVRAPIVLIGGDDGHHFGIDGRILRGDVDVAVGVAGGKHDDNLLAHRVDDGVVHAGVVAVHLPAAVDHVAARGIAAACAAT